MTARELRAKLADWICLWLAPGKLIINPRFRPFERLADGQRKETSASLAAQHLIHLCHDRGVSRVVADVEGFSVLGVESGDWRVTVEKIGPR